MKRIVLLSAIAVLIANCGMHRRISSLRQTPVSAYLTLPVEKEIPLSNLEEYEDKDISEVHEPGSVLIMNAIKDENGEMTATDVIRASMVTARFRNVAEREGKVDLNFQIIVPQELQDGRWQLRLDPDMYILEDSIRLEPVIITGAMYRRRQLKGYEQYRKFMDSIISDPEKFINIHQLELFLKRNIPQVYRFRTDSSFVSDEQFASAYGITEQAAVSHYTNQFMVNRNERRKARTGKMYDRFVKAPLTSEGIRLDTVIATPEGDFIYDYIQTIRTRPRLRKAEIVLSGAILEEGKEVMDIPSSQPLTFYISSLSSFSDTSMRYLTKVIYRKLEANTICYVDFLSGKTDIDPDLSNNRNEISRIKNNLSDILSDKEYELDSIIITASCSPEGATLYNTELSKRRASSISGYFGKFLEICRDSIRHEAGLYLGIGMAAEERHRDSEVKFISRSAGENWHMLDDLVACDNVLSENEKAEYRVIREIPDPDDRENRLGRTAFYKYLREKLYPRLRTVRFDFHLHRKGMVADTVRTTIPDMNYMDGVRAIADRDYKKAISILRPYNDFNLAIAYCAMGYNASAMDILCDLAKSDKVYYMLAILHSRNGDYRKAKSYYDEACKMNPSLVHRGNLDPEISGLSKHRF